MNIFFACYPLETVHETDDFIERQGHIHALGKISLLTKTLGPFFVEKTKKWYHNNQVALVIQAQSLSNRTLRFRTKIGRARNFSEWSPPCDT
ncbi:hypothetical protein ACFL6N_02895, partial [Thermodesulfobacteriota bacterium]